MARLLGKAAAGALVALGLTACSAEHVSPQVQDKVGQWIHQHFGVTGTAVCPSSAQATTGSTFTCQANIDGNQVAIKVTFTSATQFTMATDSGAVGTPAQLAAGIKSAYKERTPPVSLDSVDCGQQAFMVEPPGKTFTCTAVKDGTTHTLAVTVTDSAGNVQITDKPS